MTTRADRRAEVAALHAALAVALDALEERGDPEATPESAACCAAVAAWLAGGEDADAALAGAHDRVSEWNHRLHRVDDEAPAHPAADAAWWLVVSARNDDDHDHPARPRVRAALVEVYARLGWSSVGLAERAMEGA